MVDEVPQRIVKPELVKQILIGSSRKQKFKQLQEELMTLKSQQRYNKMRSIEIRKEMAALFPDCIVVNTPILHIRKKRLTLKQRMAKFPESFGI